MALITLEFQLNGGKKITLSYQEAELIYKDLQRIFAPSAGNLWASSYEAA